MIEYIEYEKLRDKIKAQVSDLGEKEAIDVLLDIARHINLGCVPEGNLLNEYEHEIDVILSNAQEDVKGVKGTIDYTKLHNQGSVQR